MERKTDRIIQKMSDVSDISDKSGIFDISDTSDIDGYVYSPVS